MRSRKSQSGFTLTELLIVIALMFIIAALGIPALMNLAHRTRVEGAAREATMFLQQARMNAAKNNVPVVVGFDFGTYPALEAFTDFDNNGLLSPDPLVTEARATDFVIATYRLPGQVGYRGPGGDNLGAVTAFSTAGGNPVIVFRPDGSVVAPGDFVVGDVRGNFLRVALSRTAKTELSKWNRDTSLWEPQDQGAWTWY